MSRRLRPLTAADLALLPDPCSRCSFWGDGLSDLTVRGRRSDRPEARWELAEAVTRQWGYCGVLAVDGDELLGYATLAPAQSVSPNGLLDHLSAQPDAAVLLSTYVAEPYRRQGLGRQLIQSAAGLMVRRDVRSIEAVGSYRDDACGCPVGFLQRVGFSVVRPHPVTPRLRMDMQSTVRWLPDLGAAWSRLTGLMPHPSPGPEPAHRQSSAAPQSAVDAGLSADSVRRERPVDGGPVDGRSGRWRPVGRGSADKRPVHKGVDVVTIGGSS